MFLYSLGLAAALIIASPYWLLRMLFSGRYRDGLGQRLGFVPKSLRGLVGGRRTIWVHAVSVGEVIAVARLVERLNDLDPETPVVISTTTRTGQQLAKDRFDKPGAANTRVFYWPLDFAWMVRRYLRVVWPRMIVLVESELWPRMLVEARAAGIPLVVVNGRISDRSLPRYRALHRLWRPFLRRLSLVLAQSDQDRQRFTAIGVPADIVETAGNLKYDVRAADDLPLLQLLREHLPQQAKIIVAGSTMEDEEAQLLTVLQHLLVLSPDFVLILAPRHPDRFKTVAQLIEDVGLPCIRRSQWIAHPQAIPAGVVFLLDSIGELASVYSVASVAFVGGSLVPAGGHNPLEPAQFGIPIVVGPHTANFRGVVAALLEKNAVRVTPPEGLEATLRELLTSPAAQQMGARARQVFEQHAGASERCLIAIQRILRDEAKYPQKEAGFR